MARHFDYQKEASVGDWKCVTVQEPWNDVVKVYLMQARGNDRYVANIEKGKMVLTLIKEGEIEHEPFLTLPYFAWQSVLETLGSITPDIKKEVVDAELLATKFHLEDMRKLVFKVSNSSSDEEI